MPAPVGLGERRETATEAERAGHRAHHHDRGAVGLGRDPTAAAAAWLTRTAKRPGRSRGAHASIVGESCLTARSARDTRSAMSAVLTVERKQIDTKPPKRQPAVAHEDRLALDEDSPFLLLAGAVVQQARVDRTHRCSSNCKRCRTLNQCQRAAISARLFLTALRTTAPAWGGVWLDWLQYAAVRAGATSRRRRGYSP